MDLVTSNLNNQSREIEIEKSTVLNNWRSLDGGRGRTARWVEFWSEAAAEELEFAVERNEMQYQPLIFIK